MSQPTPEWIAVDWGTSNLRVWAMQGSQMLDHRSTDSGMATLARSAFEPALNAALAGWTVAPDTPIIACGMVGSRQGWVEAPYTSVPCAPLGQTLAKAPDTALNVHVISGLKQDTPADVMRGEETQIAGYLALNPGWDGVICLPGTHAKWVQISAGEVVSFQTFMTGELFALLSGSSVLRHSVSSENWDDDSFATAVTDSLSRPEKLAAALFGIRASDLLQGTDAGHARARLSGLLIGAELAAARPYWLGQDIAIIGAAAPAQAYATALAAQGVPATIADVSRMTLAGLTAAYRHWKDLT